MRDEICVFLPVNSLFYEIRYHHSDHNLDTIKMCPAKSPELSGLFAIQTAILLCAKMQMPDRRFPFVDRLKRPQNRIQIRKADREKNSICLFYFPQKGVIDYAAERISQASQRSVRYQDEQRRMAGGVLGRAYPSSD